MIPQEKSTQKDRLLFAPRQLFGLRLGDILKFMSSLLLPLALGVFTVIITFQQQNAAKQQRDEDRKSSELQREQEKSLEEQRYKNEALDTFIKDMGKLLKENNGFLTANRVTATLARVKTLNILRELDAQRNMRVIRFLYEANQLAEVDGHSPLDLSAAELRDMNFRRLSIIKMKITNLSLTGVFLSNATFAGVDMEYVDFATNQFDNVNFFSDYINNVSFSFTRLNNSNFSYGKFRNANFLFSSLFNVNFSFSALINTHLPSTQIEHGNFSFTQLFNVSFSSAQLDHINFSFAQFYHVDFSSCLLANISFSHARFVDVNFSSATLQNVDFSYANINYADFSSAQLLNVNFSFAILRKDYHNFIFFYLSNKYLTVFLASANFGGTAASYVEFRRATCIAVLFSSAILSESSFRHSNIKHASFEDAKLNNVDFFRANLYKADFSGAEIEDSNLQSALSTQDALKDDETVFHDRNLLNDDQYDCNISLDNSWILQTGNVTKRMSNKSNISCQFTLQLHNERATMLQRINLSNKWDSSTWPNSRAVLRANMSDGVSMRLKGIKRNCSASAKEILDSSRENISLILQDDMWGLEVNIEFSVLNNQSDMTHHWYENIKLFIIYGTYLEFLRVEPNIPVHARWVQDDVTVTSGHDDDNDTNQLNAARGLFVDDDQSMIIVDTGNNRVMQWKWGDPNGQVIVGDNESEDQLNNPTDVLIDKKTNSLIICDQGNRRVLRWSRRSDTTQGEILVDNIDCHGLAMGDQRFFYVSDIEKNEIRQYTMGYKNGTLMAGGHGRGSGFHQLFAPRHLFVDRQQVLYVSDWGNHRVMKWNKGAKEGIVVAGGRGYGKALTQLYFPEGLFVDTSGTIYVADIYNDRVMRWPQGAKQGTIIVGDNRKREEADQFLSPTGLSFDRHGNIYIINGLNNQIHRFSLE
ncbi:unnamed protein product [Rotaria magnacalcarata]|uniref:Uncharacterized protein n=1 Tax=Rotaria magnacalcarata TaxID=392030 RepID=A0A816UIS3_9BILA|nr:unnamed protein product [Rotaria magnacalcarata]